VSLGDAVDKVTQVAKQMLPPTVTTSFQGSAKVFQSSMSNLTLLLVSSRFGVVYIVLGTALRELHTHPITNSRVCLSGRSSVVGRRCGCSSYELNIYSFVRG
jgi:HAE1 family hydrophobic/amphiphilic exporter-1